MDSFMWGSVNRSRIFGIDIVESKERPKYVLPEEVIPGVPWPTGFREEINRWSEEFLGTTGIVPRGMVYMLGNNVAIMNRACIVEISNLT